MAVRNLKADILIIGAGPAGLAAGIYAARAGKKTLILEGRAASRLSIDYVIENYPGFISIKSRELLTKFREHAERFGAEIVAGDALAFGLDGEAKFVTTKDALIEARAIILATGRPVPKTRLIPGEEKFLGQGVSYCATCDGPLFRGAAVAAVGRSEEAMEDIVALHGMGCRVTWVPEGDRPEVPDPVAARIEGKGIDTRWGAKAVGIVGQERVAGLVIDTAGRPETVPVAAVFVFREIPAGLLLDRAGIALDHKQCVSVDRFMRTSVPGVFAAGDVTCGGLQVVTAAGEGSLAAMQALLYLGK